MTILSEWQSSLVAFVFGEGTRSTPLTETDNAQKPAIGTFVQVQMPDGTSRYLSMVELAMRYFIGVQQYLKRSGFKGLVVKWGDEVQIPTLDISGTDPLFQDADIVRFVSLRQMNEDEAKNKDWVGVSADGHVSTFISRKPGGLEEMRELVPRGLIYERNGKLYGWANLGSIGISYVFVEVLLEEFRNEVNDPTANMEDRPALDPEFFTAITIAVIPDDGARAAAWEQAKAESKDVRKLAEKMPDVLDRIRRALAVFRQRYGRSIKMVAMDFADQYWGDIGQHLKIFEFYMTLNDQGPEGEIARAIAGIPSHRDVNGNIIVNSTVSPNVTVRRSVLLNVTITGSGIVENSVLIGTRTSAIHSVSGYDFGSIAPSVTIEPRGGTYKVISDQPVHAGPGERLTTLFMPTYGTHLMRAMEDTDLRNKRNYGEKDKQGNEQHPPILGNPVTFRQAHEDMGQMTIEQLEAIRGVRQQEVTLQIAAALREVVPADAQGNVKIGDVHTEAVRDSILVAEPGRRIEAQGLTGVIIVHAADGMVLVIPETRAQEVKQLMEAVARAATDEPVLLDCANCQVRGQGSRVAALGLQDVEVIRARNSVTVRAIAAPAPTVPPAAPHDPGGLFSFMPFVMDAAGQTSPALWGVMIVLSIGIAALGFSQWRPGGRTERGRPPQGPYATSTSGVTLAGSAVPPAMPPARDLKGPQALNPNRLIRKLIREGRIVELTYHPSTQALSAYKVHYVQQGPGQRAYRPGVTDSSRYRGEAFPIDELLDSSQQRALLAWIAQHHERGAPVQDRGVLVRRDAPVRLRVALGLAALGWRDDVEHSNISQAGFRDQVIYIGESLLRHLFTPGHEALRQEVLDQDELRHLERKEFIHDPDRDPDEYAAYLARLQQVGEVVERLQAPRPENPTQLDAVGPFGLAGRQVDHAATRKRNQR
jgi:hypothetical protein